MTENQDRFVQHFCEIRELPLEVREVLKLLKDMELSSEEFSDLCQALWNAPPRGGANFTVGGIIKG